MITPTLAVTIWQIVFSDSTRWDSCKETPRCEKRISVWFFETPVLFQDIEPEHLPRQARAKHITRQAPQPSGVLSENRA